jgi:hypothetical protein
MRSGVWAATDVVRARANSSARVIWDRLSGEPQEEAWRKCKSEGRSFWLRPFRLLFPP